MVKAPAQPTNRTSARRGSSWPAPCIGAGMPNAMLKIHPEPFLDVNPCPLCGGQSGELISERVAGGHGIDTHSCHHCGAVYQPVSWSSEELHAAYEAELLGETETLTLPIPEATMTVGDPFFDKVKSALLTGRANNAIALSYMQPGDRVLQLGCGAGETLVTQREALGIECFGVELSDQIAEVAEDNRIEVQVTSIDSPDFHFEELDEIQAFHFIQRVPDPLLWLQRCWDSLAVGGRIVVEVPNLYHPQGALGEAFLRPTHLHSWSESTLTALLRRAGFVVERVVSTLTLFAVGRKESADARDIAFSSALLSHPEHDSQWVSSRLRNYDAMEKTRASIRRDGPDMDKMHQLVHQLMKPAFDYHVVQVGLDLIDFFLSHRAVGLACLLATAASEGPYDAELAERFAKLAKVIREEGVAAVGLPASTEAPAPTEMLRDHTKRQPTKTAPPPPRKELVAAMIEEMRRDYSGKAAFQIPPRAPFNPGGIQQVQA
jgi:SAM-dependent methyltransferase